MLRRTVAGGIAAVLLVGVLAGCGGNSASPSASPEASTAATEAPIATEAPVASESPSVEPGQSADTGGVKMAAACANVALRKDTSTTADQLVRIAKGTKVHVVETVTGEAYQTSGCGTSGSDWVKVDKVNGKTVKKLYGVDFAYGAAGFFK